MSRSEQLGKQFADLSAKRDAEPVHFDGFAKNISEEIEAYEVALQRDMPYGQLVAMEAEVKSMRKLRAQVLEEAARRRAEL